MDKLQREVLLAEIVRREWDAQGSCDSCNWHAALGEYGETDAEIADQIYFNRHSRRLELACRNKDYDDERCWHRGVRIYPTDAECAKLAENHNA